MPLQVGAPWPKTLRLDKEDDGGRWLLTYELPGESAVLRLRIEVGGPMDWFGFRAEVQHRGTAPVALGTFDIAPTEIFPVDSARQETTAMAAWEPKDETDFLKIAARYQAPLVMMVHCWGHIAGALTPAPARRTIH